MKYLKLIVQPQEPEDKHITFAFFGSAKVDQNIIQKYIKKIDTFELNNPRNDMFGPKNDIPVVAYDYNKDINQIRKEMLLALGPEISDQNILEWAPHISHIQLDENKVEEKYKVIGIKSNDGLFGMFF
jgi:hypothetical protein